MFQYAQYMRRVTGFLLALVLVSTTASSWADNDTLPPPVYDIPFDDIDPAITQVALSKEVTNFVSTVHRHWGTGLDSLRQSVTGSVEREDRSTLVLGRSLADHDIVEGYDFHEGALIGGQYLLLQRPVNGLNEFIDYFAAAKQALTATYGSPIRDQLVWENDLYQPLPDYWGVAVQIGHLTYQARWETSSTSISLELKGQHHSRLSVTVVAQDPSHPRRQT